MNQIDNTSFGSKNICECYTMKRIKDLYESKDTYQEISIPQQGELQKYLLDPEFRDEVMFREGGIVHIKWF